MKRIYSNRQLAEEFGDAYDTGKLSDEEYEAIEQILDKYDDNGQKLVTELFEEASKSDQQKLLELAGIQESDVMKAIRLMKNAMRSKDIDDALDAITFIYDNKLLYR